MPYISQKDRERIKPHIDQFWEGCRLMTEGEMNYAITQLLEKYRRGVYAYSKFNELIGLLDCIKLEYYRRMVASYEDTKQKENGDVYSW